MELNICTLERIELFGGELALLNIDVFTSAITIYTEHVSKDGILAKEAKTDEDKEAGINALLHSEYISQEIYKVGEGIIGLSIKDKNEDVYFVTIDLRTVNTTDRNRIELIDQSGGVEVITLDDNFKILHNDEPADFC